YTEEQMKEAIMEQFDGRKILLLAPVVRGRKGHYRELFEQIRKQGYAKVRIDGEVLDIKAGMKVDRYKVHDIEVVVDRIRVNAERANRLNTSLQTALKMGNGLVFIMDHDSGEARGFSKHLMDPGSGISYEEPSPNSFSFNSPYGACPHCNGLGKVNKVDYEKVIPDDTKSINDTGIVPLGEVRQNMTFKQLRAIAKKYEFTFATPVKEIPEQALNIILYGGDDALKVKADTNSDFSYNLA
ncbi:MAG: excinuclease ABC subunit UvrA, partial [Phaeodactylibacter sp.]|nr:excinuclease ABC subunit UvrA [Phaeodactylibacter sp.]